MKILFVILFILVGSACSFAFDGYSFPQFHQIDSAFYSGNYEQVELITLRLLQDKTELDDKEYIYVYLTAGHSLIMLNRESEARDYYRRALDVNPDLTLNPAEVSPKFRMVFDDVKSSYEKKQSVEPSPSQIETRAARGSHILNLFLPGSGQFRENSEIKGTAFFVLQVASVAFLLNQVNETQNSREIYLAESDPQKISAAYDDYNKNHSLVWISAGSAAAIYLAAQLDLILLRKPATLQLTTQPHPSLQVSLNF